MVTKYSGTKWISDNEENEFIRTKKPNFTHVLQTIQFFQLLNHFNDIFQELAAKTGIKKESIY